MHEHIFDKKISKTIIRSSSLGLPKVAEQLKLKRPQLFINK